MAAHASNNDSLFLGGKVPQNNYSAINVNTKFTSD